MHQRRHAALPSRFRPRMDRAGTLDCGGPFLLSSWTLLRASCVDGSAATLAITTISGCGVGVLRGALAPVRLSISPHRRADDGDGAASQLGRVVICIGACLLLPGLDCARAGLMLAAASRRPWWRVVAGRARSQRHGWPAILR